MYQMQDRVRFSEMDENGRMTIPAIMNRMQDCSDRQSEELGIGYDFLAERNRGWVIATWQMFIDRRPACRELITVETRPWKFDLFFGHRNFAVYDAAGVPLVRTNSIWCFLDTGKMRAVRPTEEEIAPYGVDDPISMEYTKARKIHVPAERTAGEPFPVLRRHLDMNHHVNNVQYISMALDLFPEEPEICELRAEYRKAARQGDIIHPFIARDGDWQIISLADASGSPYAVVEFRPGKEEKNV